MRFAVLLVFFLIALCCPVFAEYYKYVNQDGVVCYTDDLSRVSEQQRVELKKFHEIKTYYEHKIEPERAKVAKKRTTKINDSKADELRRMNIELDKKFLSLKAERESLMAMQNDLSGKKAVKEFNIKANALNKSVIDFEKRKAVYLKKVNEYNKQIN